MAWVIVGVLAAAWDLLLIKIKHTLKAVVSDAKTSAGKGT